MDNSKLTELLNKVITASNNKKLDWEKNTKTETSFKALLGKNTLHILRTGSSTYFIIVNEAGDQIGSLSGVLYASSLNNLYEIAKKKALRIDESLDEINSMLDSII